MWQVILTPAVLLSLKALGQCSAGPTGLALPQRADSMAGADLWIFICHICGSCQPNGFFASMAFLSPRGAAALNHARSEWLQRFFWLVEIELGGWGFWVRWNAVIGGRRGWGFWVKLVMNHGWMLFMTSHGGLKINTSEWVGVCAWIYPEIFSQMCPTRWKMRPNSQIN